MESGMDIFNLNEELFLDKKQAEGLGIDFYKPYPENGRDGTYSSLIRFLPNIADLKQSKIHKYYVYLTDPVSGDSFAVDCPSTVGKKSILKDLYWKLKNSKSASDQDLAPNFSRKEDYYSLIQVIKDINRPELEGKIILFKYGRKINEKIEAQIKPKYGKPSNPFDLMSGRIFSLEVRKVGEWNNYDQCSFVGEPTPIEINNRPMSTNAEDTQTIIEYLKSGPQNLTSFAFKEWDEETEERVNNVIRNTVRNEKMIEGIVSSVINSNISSSPSSIENIASSGVYSPMGNTPNQFYQDAKNLNAIDNQRTSTSDYNASNNKQEASSYQSSPSSLDDLYKDL